MRKAPKMSSLNIDSPKASDKDVIDALIRISQLTNSDKDIDELYSEIHRIVESIVYVKNIAIAQVNISEHIMTLKYFLDEKDGQAYQGKTIDIGNGLSAYSLKLKHPISLNEQQIIKLQEGGKIDRVYGTMCKSWVGVPILHEEEILGLLIVQSYHADFEYTERDVEVLTFVGTNIGILLKQRQILEEENKIRDELLQKEKMASLGSLVAGVAHEINTPLGVCVTGITNLIDEYNDFNKAVHDGSATDEQFQNFMEDVSATCNIVKSNVERAAKLISSFKQIAVDQSSEDLRQINMLEYLHEIVHSLHPMIRKTKHKIEIDCPNDLELTTQPGAVSQLFTNLIANSLIHGFEDIPQGNIKITATKGKDAIEFLYKDDGKGMPAENQKRFFDPFFTTKRNSGGSGLGGQIIYNIVHNVLRGQVYLSTAENQGVEFKITVPAQNL